MTTDVYRVRIEVPHTGGLPQNSIINTWHYRGDPDNVTQDADLDVIETELDAFYTAWVGSWGSAQYAWNTMLMTSYNMLDERPRVPIDTRTFAGPSLSTGFYDLPPEVAVVLTLDGGKSSGQLNRRRRGRIYVGPFTISPSADMHVVPAGLITALSTGASTLLHPTAGTVTLVVYSEYNRFGVPLGETLTHGPKDPVTGNRPLIDPPREEVTDEYLDFTTPVSTIHIDNAWDTQRRRGTPRTTRTSITD